jgi:hypothetical protein
MTFDQVTALLGVPPLIMTIWLLTRARKDIDMATDTPSSIAPDGAPLYLRTIDVSIDIEAEAHLEVDADLILEALHSAARSGWRVADIRPLPG